MMELHIWGPAFSLPSIDPECLAAVAYLTQAVPSGKWMLVSNHDNGSKTIRELPALRDAKTVVSGFPSIVDHLRKVSNGQWDLDADLDQLQKADCFAFSTLLTTHALPLLDLSLYVSTQNYTTTTRPAYACLLSFPTSWSLPQKRRAIAKQRSAHLGLSSLDLENATSSDGDSDSNPTAGTLSLPHSLRKARQSISAAVKSPETASRIRLEVLTEQLLDPLATLLGSTTPKRVSKTSGKGESYLVTSTRPSTLDCLAIGYLALFLLPEVPIPFLATSLKEKYPNLADYVRDGVKRCYGGAVKSEDARSGLRIESVRAKNLEPDNSDEDEGLELAQYENMDIGSGQAPVVLPWRDAAPSSVLESVGLVLRDAVEGVPLLGDLVKSDTIMHSQSPVEDNGGQRYFPVVTGLGVGIAVIAATVVWSGVSGAGGNSLRRTNGRRDEGARLEDMGETGDLLAFGGFGERNTSTDASRAGLGVES